MAITGLFPGIRHQRASSGLWVSVADTVGRFGHHVLKNGVLTPMTRLDFTKTQRFWNSDVPATQTRSIPAGTYVCWVEGAGQVVLSGTGVVGSPSNTVTQGNPSVFTIGVLTNVTFTVTPALSIGQCEQGKAPSSFILSAAADAVRATERISAPTGSATYQDQTFYASLYEVGDTGFGNVGIFHIGNPTGATPYWRVESGTVSNQLRTVVHNGTALFNSGNDGVGFLFTDHVEVLSWIDAAQSRAFLKLAINGVEGAIAQTIAFTPPVNFSQATLGLGSNDLAGGMPMAIESVSHAQGIQTFATMRTIAVGVQDIPTGPVQVFLALDEEDL